VQVPASLSSASTGIFMRNTSLSYTTYPELFLWMQDPTCAKVTFMGKFVPVDAKDDKLARAAMFDRHPRMAKYPEDHHFSM